MKMVLPPGLWPWVERWNLIPAGESIATHTSVLLPVLAGDQPAMLKVARVSEEARGAAILGWWGGEGAARVLAREGDAVLMERATGSRSLVRMAAVDDDEATRVLCATAARLHGPRPHPPESAVLLQTWFAALAPAARREGGVLTRSQAAAQHLLDTPRERTVLHGDLHHGNVLDFGARGWLAIDPKGLYGERGFDFANIFCNPDAAIAAAPGRLERQATIVAEAANIDRNRLLTWVLAYAGLSASWSIEDGEDASLALAVADIASRELAQEYDLHF